MNGNLCFLDTLTAIIGNALRSFFLLDNRRTVIYPEYMLTGLRIFSSDNVWRQILTDLNADVVDNPKLADVDIDALDLALPTHPANLYVALMDAMDNSHIITRVLGADAHLSRLPGRIVALLYKTGGMSVADLKVALGYASDANTHTVDTAICGLRKKYGREFIKNDGGVYKLGRI